METNTPLNEARKSIESELNFSTPLHNEDQWLEVLAGQIDKLIQYDFSKLVAVLYRLDVDEAKIKQLLKNNPDTNAGRLMAELIVERQLQKIKTRQAYHRDNVEPNESEGW